MSTEVSSLLGTYANAYLDAYFADLFGDTYTDFYANAYVADTFGDTYANY